MYGETEGSFSLVAMEVWSSSASEEEDEEKSTTSLVEEVVEVEEIGTNCIGGGLCTLPVENYS